MCGICGIMLPERGPIGAHLVRMCQAMRHRGFDSTGFALYGEPDPRRYVLRLRLLQAGSAGATLDALEASLRERGVTLAELPTTDDAADAADRFARVVVDHHGAPPSRIVRAIDDVSGIEVQSVGHALEIVKDLGDAETVAARHGVEGFEGTHGIGHVRLTTESIVDVAYGHPFWAEPFADVSIVHNGQLTNYYKSRRLLEQEGYRFHTTNDSELIAVYLADRMQHGVSLWDALCTSVYELDGCFAYLFATPEAIGSAKDMFAIKSLVVARQGGVTAMATEEQALRQVFADEIETDLPEPRSVYVWDLDGSVTAEIV